jgi:hypothetical protein
MVLAITKMNIETLKGLLARPRPSLLLRGYENDDQ